MIPSQIIHTWRTRHAWLGYPARVVEGVRLNPKTDEPELVKIEIPRGLKPERGKMFRALGGKPWWPM